MTLFIAILVGFAWLAFMLLPFWRGEGGVLARSSGLTDLDKIAKLKNLIVDRYVLEEDSHEQGHISKKEWDQRRQYLTNRYLDLARRLDFVQHSQASNISDPTSEDLEESP